MRRNPRRVLKLTAGAVSLILLTAFITKGFDDNDQNGPFMLQLNAAPEVAALRQDNPVNIINSRKGDPPVNAGGAIQGVGSHPDSRKVLEVDADGKVDWTDEVQVAKDAAAQGPGEQGAAVELPKDPATEKRKESLYKVNGFNAAVSDLIRLNRSIPDIRHPGCAQKRYLARLPTVSIVIPFHNEHLSTLLRTVTSVINRSPASLIREVILVDDHSNKPELGRQLEKSVASLFGKKVRILRAKKREGLIRTRLLGAREAIGEVLLFLDSHTEANVNWLPPLLEPIAEDRHTVVCPFIDVIDYETFAYRAQDEGARGSFDWELYYKRLALLPESREKPTEPFESPVMAGGLFAMDRQYFWELGGYDEGLDVWGGEQYELSFKIWQCGGRMLDAPCSRVGHIYRKFAPFPNPGIGDFVGRNYRRVAEVWMDEYKEYLYNRRPHYRSLDYGDVSKQKALRQKLKCKPFKWFMQEVAFDQPLKYPPVEPPDFAWGTVRNIASGKCLDSKFLDQGKRFGLDHCMGSILGGRSGEQNFVLTWHRDLRPAKRNVCLDVSSGEKRAPVVLWTCHGMQGNQLFKYNLDTKQLHHPITVQCLDADPGNGEIFMNPCNSTLATQQWEFEHVNSTAIAND